MNDDFLDQLRKDAAPLRYEPADQMVWVRLRSRIRARTVASETVAWWMVRWLRPIAAATLLTALLAGWGSWMLTRYETIDTLAARPDVTIASEDFYRVAE
jgi:hypothetical protein